MVISFLFCLCLLQHSFAEAGLAAGCVLALTEEVVSGEVNNGMAVVR